MAQLRASVSRRLGVGIILLTLATAALHLYLAFAAIVYMGFNFGIMLFIFNGLGYLALLAALQLPQVARFRGAARWVLVAYTALTIVLFFVMAPTYTIIGYVDKAIEVALIALLLADAYTASSESSGETAGARTAGP